MRKRAAGAAGVLALAGLGAAVIAVSGAAASPDASFVVPGDRPVPAVTGWELVDARHISEQDGRPLDEVIEQVAGQNQFAELVTAVQSQFPQHFSTARWDPTPTSRGEIAFVELPDDGALDLIRASGLSVTVRVVGGASEQEAVAAQVRAFGAVHAVTGVRQAASTVDPAAATISIQITPDAALGAGQVAALLAEVERVAVEAVSDPSLEVAVTVGPPGGED